MIKINLKNVSKSFGKKEVLKDISLSFSPNKIYGLLGNNGVGKTTLVKTIFNEFKANSGEIKADNTNMSNWFYFSENEELPVNMSVKSYILYLSSLADIDLKIATERMDKAFEGLELNFKPSQKIKSLSSGQKKMVSCLAMLVLKPAVIFLDEPTANLDVQNKNKVLDVVKQLKSPETIIVIVTHLLKEVENVIDNAVVIDNGTVTYQGPAKGKDLEKLFDKYTTADKNYKDKIGSLINESK